MCLPANLACFFLKPSRKNPLSKSFFVDFQIIIVKFLFHFFTMRIKILKVWLFLLPVIGIIGTVLYIQSSNNITELEEQNLRSIQAVKNDMQAALPDYYQRVEGYIFREAYV